MKAILLALGLILSGMRTVVAQDTVRSFTVVMSPQFYTFENAIFIAPNVVGVMITPKGDTAIFANKTWFSNKKAPGSLGKCVFPQINPREASIDSVKVFFVIGVGGVGKVMWDKTLSLRGQTEIVGKEFTLPHGDVVKIREIYRRQFDCMVYIWFELVDGPIHAS